MGKSRYSAATLALMSVLLALALVLHVVERMLPVPQIAPGVKLGLANLVSLVGFFVLPCGDVIVIVVLRSLIASAFGGGLSGFLFSVVGGILSASGMYLLLRYGPHLFSIPSVSIVGALLHNVGQLAVAAAVIGTARIYYYLPFLIGSATLTGLLIGLTAREVLARLTASDAATQRHLNSIYRCYFR